MKRIIACSFSEESLEMIIISFLCNRGNFMYEQRSFVIYKVQF